VRGAPPQSRLLAWAQAGTRYAPSRQWGTPPAATGGAAGPPALHPAVALLPACSRTALAPHAPAAMGARRPGMGGVHARDGAPEPQGLACPLSTAGQRPGRARAGGLGAEQRGAARLPGPPLASRGPRPAPAWHHPVEARRPLAPPSFGAPPAQRDPAPRGTQGLHRAAAPPRGLPAPPRSPSAVAPPRAPARQGAPLGPGHRTTGPAPGAAARASRRAACPAAQGPEAGEPGERHQRPLAAGTSLGNQ
jgi:hypothetical protein